MKKLLLAIQFLFFLLFNISLILTGYQLFTKSYSANNVFFSTPVYDKQEEYDPSLQRLSSVDKLEAYCDSLYQEKRSITDHSSFEETFSEIAHTSVRKRFYHGYSAYGFNNNYMAMLLASASNMHGLSAVVIPDDILKFSYAACSQQSIVLMELLKRKGFNTRKVGFKGKQYGHFCFEVYYKGSWHFFDPDMEPDMRVLNAYNRPGISFLAENKKVLLAAYGKYSKEMVLDIFPNYYYGKENKFPATKAAIFHTTTKILSYTLWSFFLLAFVYTRKKYKKLSLLAAVSKRRKTFSRVAAIARPVCSPA